MFDDQKKPVVLPFDGEKLKTLIDEIVPKEYPPSRHDNIRYNIESKWKKGTLTKLIVDGVDITHMIVKSNSQVRIEDVLKMTRDFKHYYTGSIKFDVEKVEGKIVLVYVTKGHFAISKNFISKEEKVS
jgi:hypothetical protein